jgi:hypothetical protein
MLSYVLQTNLTKENLDWCCGSDYRQVEFVCVEKAYKFIKKYATTQILIRNKRDIYCAFNSIIRLFHYMDELPTNCTTIERTIEDIEILQRTSH